MAGLVGFWFIRAIMSNACGVKEKKSEYMEAKNTTLQYRLRSTFSKSCTTAIIQAPESCIA